MCSEDMAQYSSWVPAPEPPEEPPEEPPPDPEPPPDQNIFLKKIVFINFFQYIISSKLYDAVVRVSK